MGGNLVAHGCDRGLDSFLDREKEVEGENSSNPVLC